MVVAAVHIGSHREIRDGLTIEVVADLVHNSMVVIGDRVALVGIGAEEERGIVIYFLRDPLLSLRGQHSREEVRDLKLKVRDAGAAES